MGLFSNRGVDDIVREGALGAENARQHYDNIVLEREKKREAEARRQAEAEASAMAAQAKAATAQAKAAASENDKLKAQVFDYQILVNDVTNRINDPRLNAIWRVAKAESAAYGEKIDFLMRVVRLERRFREAITQSMNELAHDYGIPRGKIDASIKQKYQISCENKDDESYRWGMRIDHPEDYLFLDEKVKKMEEYGLRMNALLEELRSAKEELKNIQRQQEWVEAQKKTDSIPTLK